MAGKPEQPISHPAPQNHVHQQHYQQHHSLHIQTHHHHHHQNQINRRNHQQDHQQISQHEPQSIQHNSVLVYVPGENFAYTTAVGHNAEQPTNYQSGQQQQQGPYQDVLPQVATQPTFPTKINFINNSELDNDVNSNSDCCLGKTLELVSCDVVVNQQQHQSSKEEEEFNTNYQGSLVGLTNGRVVVSPNSVEKIDLNALGNISSGLGGLRSPAQSDADSLSGTSDSGVATSLVISRPALSNNAVIVGEQDPKTFSTHYEVTCNSGYSTSRLSETYQNTGTGNDTDCITTGTLNENRITYVSQNVGNQLSTNVFLGGTQELIDPQKQRDICKEIRVNNQDSLDLNSRTGHSVITTDPGCESVRSDTAESAYSSSLSSPECQNLQSSESVNNNSVCAQPAACLVPQVSAQHSNNVALTMNGSVVTQNQQTQQQQASIAAPRGWKRICTDRVIIYISPSSTALRSLDQLKEYLTTAGTCKCGLECPLRPEQVFNFDPKVATRPWSPDQGKTREMTKLCNHKRKLLLPVAAASPVASCTPVVSSSTLPVQGPPGIHASADSPTSSDKSKKDGLNKKKKRKLGSVGNLYSGVSVSQLIAQRERAIAVAGATGVQALPSSNGSQVWPMTALPIQQNNQQIGHQLLNSPSQNLDSNACVVRNPQQRLNPHNMTSMLMGNPLIMNQQGTNFNNMSQQQQQLMLQQQQQQQQVQQQQLMQQHMTQHHQNVITNQLPHQQSPHYINQMNDQSVHAMQQQHMNQQQMHIQQMQQKHPQHQHQQENQQINFNHHVNDNFLHHLQSNQNSSQNQIHAQMHQMHQHSMQYQQQSNQHMMQNQTHDQFHMLQHQQQQQQQQMSQVCQPMQFNHQTMSHHLGDISQQTNNGSLMSGINATDGQVRHNRIPSMDEDMNAKQMSQQHQQQLMMHNHNMQRHHIQNGNMQNLSHENMQRMYVQHQVSQFQQRSCDPKTSNMELKSGHQQYMLVSQAGRSPTSGNVVDTQAINGNGQTGNHHFNQRTQMWQQNRSITPSHQSPSSVSVQNITCNSLDRVPPLHHHIPPTTPWTDEIARKKAKPSKSSGKKQRHQHMEMRNNLEQSSPSPDDDFNDKSQANNQIGSTVNNSPSFLDDPSGYLAQQTALLNSTISRQTGVSSSQMMVNNSKIQGNHGNNYLPQQKPSSATSPSSSMCNSVKNHATSPVVVHSSMTPTSLNNNTNDSDNSSCQGCVTSADTQSYLTEQYKQQIHRQYIMHSDQRDDPVTSSTFGERFTNQQMESWPIQGGTISTSRGSPIGTSSPANSDIPPSSISQPATPQSLISSQPSTPHSYSQPPTPHSHSGQIPPPPLTPVNGQQPSQSTISNNIITQDQLSGLCSISSASSSVSPSSSPSQIAISCISGSTENASVVLPNGKQKQSAPDGYQPHPHTLNPIQRITIIPYSGSAAIITTMASGHTFSSNTITSVLAGKANTATVSINTPSGIPNPAIPNILANKTQHSLQQAAASTNVVVSSSTVHHSSVPSASSTQSQSTAISKSPLEMVQSVVSSIQVPQASTGSTIQQQTHQQDQQSNVHVQNVLTSGSVLKQSGGSTLPPGHILVSSGGQLIMASTGSGISGVMAPPPPKIISNASSMPPLSVSPMVTSVTGTVSQVIPAVGVAQQVLGQPTVLVNTIQTPVLIQPSVMTMDGIGQNVQIPHLTVAAGNVLQNAQSIIEANQDVTRTVTTNQSIVNRQPTLLSPESAISKKKVYKKRKSNSQTVASMLHIASSQQNTGMLMQSQSNFAQQNFQAQSIGGPMLQALTIVPGKGGAPAQLVMNGQAGATSAQFNTQQIITNPQPAQQINLLQPVNLLNGATGMVQNFPTIQQFIVPGLGSMVMSADGTATLLQDTGNLGMQLQIQNVNGQNVLTPIQSHSGIFSPSQSILAAGPAGMVIRAPQAAGGKIIQQHSPGAQFLSSNSGQFLVNGTTSFSNQLSPIVANVSPNQQMTFNTSQVRPSNIQGQQEFIQMNGQTLMVPCGTAQNIAVSSASNQQNTTFVQQNTTIVQQQTTMVSNNQIPDFQSVTTNNGNNVDQSLNLDHNQSYILSAGMIQGKCPASPKSTISSPSSEQSVEQRQQQQFNLTSINGNKNSAVIDTNGQQNDQHSPSMVRHSVSTQTAGNQANNTQSTLMRQGSPPDTTTHSPGNSQRSNSPAVDTTTHGAASPAPPITARHHSSSTPMVHCISSSEPDSGDIQTATEDWRIQGIATKEMTLSQAGLHGKTLVESTVTTGIQIYTPETLKQTEGVVSTVRCEGREHTLGRGIKRKLDSIHSMHSTLHEDQDVSEDKGDKGNDWKLKIGELVWGAALGSPAWPGKVESLGPPGSLTVYVRWYGGGNTLTEVEIKNLKSLSDGLEAHHRARKRFRKNRKLNMQLENAIQEAMAELDKMGNDRESHKEIRKQFVQSTRSSKITSSSTNSTKNRSESRRSKKLNAVDSQKVVPKCR